MRTNARGTSAVTLDAAHHDRGPLSTATRRATVAPMPPERPSAATTARSIGARAAAQAAEQRGVVDRAALVTLGWSKAAIDRRIAEGLLRVLWPGVYAYGHSILTRDGWLMAATLACGEGAVLAQRASAAARGLLTAWSTIDVITPTKRGVGLDGIRAHRVRLRPEERDVHRGLPVTSLARTALDVAASEGAERVGELLDRALLEGQYDHTEMTALFRTRRGCRGMATLRIAVAALGDEGVIFRSWPERRARDLLRAAGIREFTVRVVSHARRPRLRARPVVSRTAPEPRDRRTAPPVPAPAPKGRAAGRGPALVRRDRRALARRPGDRAPGGVPRRSPEGA
jgi:hypothetical protein